jgi:mannose-6-phosphate isomerase-like protein (cupin superfamily)
MAPRPAPPSSFDLYRSYISLAPTGDTKLIDNVPGPPPDVDGLLVGAFHMTEDPPISGEMHPDGDEILVLWSGAMDVVLEHGGEEIIKSLAPGEAFVVPRGVWHRTVVREPSDLLHITPGHSKHRPA